MSPAPAPAGRDEGSKTETNMSAAQLAKMERKKDAEFVWPTSQPWRPQSVENVQHKMQEVRELDLIEDEAERNEAKEAKKNVVREAVMGASAHQYAIIYAPPSYREDREIISVCAANCGDSILYATDELKDDHDIAMAAVKQNGDSLRYVSERLRDDKEICLAAVRQNGRALRRCSQKMQNDYDVVIAAVQHCGMALRYASKSMQSNRSIAFEAVAQDNSAYAYVPSGTKVKTELEDWLESSWGLPINRDAERKQYRDVRGEWQLPPPGKIL
eukprot:TRINITY_DN101282_c0_g1_i1.p1 TRINITY_DN101282_c0_g1~~TRINITY_DN101282_c0_g1_i1.p1  ORF type:complete len:272 (-),score=80.65 TRINITY_DN101282_c0_g1_i1:96-911(-)